jgi:hypothetical protein
LGHDKLEDFIDTVEPVHDGGDGIIGDGDRAEVRLNPIELMQDLLES